MAANDLQTTVSQCHEAPITSGQRVTPTLVSNRAMPFRRFQDSYGQTRRVFWDASAFASKEYMNYKSLFIDFPSTFLKIIYRGSSSIMDIAPSNSNMEFNRHDSAGYEEARQRVNIMIQFLAAEEVSGEHFHLSIRRPSHLDRDVILLTHYDGPWSRVLPCSTDIRRLSPEAKAIVIFETLLMALVGNGESAGLGRPKKISVAQAWLADMFNHVMTSSDIPQNVFKVREATVHENDRISIWWTRNQYRRFRGESREDFFAGTGDESGEHD